MVKLGDSVSVFLGDAYEMIGAFKDDCRLIGDPPWGIGWRGGHNTGRRKEHGYGGYLRTDGDFPPIVGDDKPFNPKPFLRFKTVCLWGANNYSHLLPPSRGWLVWNKLDGKTPTDGSDCELAWTNMDMPIRMYTHLWRGLIRAGEENISKARKLHPHQKPVALMAWVLRTLKVTVGDTVIDPFMGSGSLGVACWRLGINYVGMEIDPHYYEIAGERLLKELAQPPLFAHMG